MNIAQAKDWLTKSALPLWLTKGVDAENGGFVESLSLERAEPLSIPRRCTVQSRQIYVCRMAIELGLYDARAARNALENGLSFLLRFYSLPNGAFCHTVQASGSPDNQVPDLYAQAFALFALANAYAVDPRAATRERALALLAYLDRERRLPEGGYSEWENGKTILRSNPHMHLFEAAIAWMEVDRDPVWFRIAQDLLNLCLARFIDPQTGYLAENFTEGWKRELVDGRFIYEPGHLFEWSWLMGRYQNLTSRDLTAPREKLFALAESTGLFAVSHYVFDQMWSDATPKARSSRFWPHCERIKAASALGKKAETLDGLSVLARYFDLQPQGLWLDQWVEGKGFLRQPAKSSSLYHILGAITEAQALA